MTWAEVTGSPGGDAFLGRLTDRKLGPAALIEGLEPRGDLSAAHDYWFQGGYPEPWLISDPGFRSDWAEQYLQTYLQRDVKALFPGLDDVRFRRFVEMLGGSPPTSVAWASRSSMPHPSQPGICGRCASSWKDNQRAWES